MPPDDAALEAPPVEAPDDLRSTIESVVEAEAPAEGAPTPTPAPGGGRDSLGRFLPKQQAESGVAGAPSVPAPAQSLAGAPSVPATPLATAPPAPEIQAPAGWGPAVREHWASLPQPVREHIVQREQQMQRWANDTAPLRNAGEQFFRTIQPYEAVIRAEGVDPLTAVNNLMQITSTMRFGTPREKAGLVAQVVQAYGVDIATLDSALAGTMPAESGPVNVQAEVQRALQPLYQQAQQAQMREIRQIEGQAHTELQTFAGDPGHEFLGDVRLLMADLIDVADRQGTPLQLQEAYDRACALHPEVSKVIMARQQGASAQQLTRNAQRARSAAVSVRGSAPVGNPNGAEPSSIRDSIEAAIEHHSRV